MRTGKKEGSWGVDSAGGCRVVLHYCRNVCPTWVKFNSKDTKESERWFELWSTKFEENLVSF